jgi:hypothetical protein
VKHGKWWIAWTDKVPGALTQGATLDEARENLIDAVHMIQEPVDLTRYVNLADPRRTSTIPRHTEIDDLLARKICQQLGVPDPK